MEKRKPIDLRAALNAVSDVVQNRPRPIRSLDQIYMKSGDMVMQSEAVAKWADGKRLAFIGDGDAISVCVAYFQKREILDYGPAKIMLFDFDERIVKAVKRFADKERLDNLDAQLYNVVEPIPENAPTFDCFYTNPPWGASNEGVSVKAFVRRGMEVTAYAGEGMVVIADDHELEWPQVVLAKTQVFALESGFYVQRMASQLHLYHLDDDPDLRSCNLMLKALPGNEKLTRPPSAALDPAELEKFYGRDGKAKVRYVREKLRVDYGKASDHEYDLEPLEMTK